MTEPTVSASYATAFVEFAVSLGADRAALFAEARVDQGALTDPDARLALTGFKALLRASRALTGDAAIALHFGECPLFFERSILGLIIRSASTMGEALRQMNRFGPVINDFPFYGSDGRFALVREEGGIWLEDRRCDPNDFPEITESAFARLVCEYERIYPERVRFALTVEMTHEAPAWRAEYERILRAPLFFKAARNAIRIDEAWLTAPIPTANSYVFGIFSARAEALLKELEQSRTLSGRIESLLIPILHAGDIGMDEVAGKMGLSRSSLYRRLREEGTSYDIVLDNLRRRMAEHYLSAGKASVSEVAYLIGFSEPGAFSKAYRRWTGKSPSEAKAGKGAKPE